MKIGLQEKSGVILDIVVSHTRFYGRNERWRKVQMEKTNSVPAPFAGILPIQHKQ
jgi:hypothetical protein